MYRGNTRSASLSASLTNSETNGYQNGIPIANKGRKDNAKKTHGNHNSHHLDDEGHSVGNLESLSERSLGYEDFRGLLDLDVTAIASIDLGRSNAPLEEQQLELIDRILDGKENQRFYEDYSTLSVSQPFQI